MLAHQIAIITGSGQGIGAEATQLFAHEGAKVVVQDIDAGTYPPRCHTVCLLGLKADESSIIS